MYEEIDYITIQCHSCQVTGALLNNKQPIVSTEIIYSGWGTLAIDIQNPYPTNDYSVFLIDYKSRYPVVLQTKNPTSSVVIKGLEQTFSLFGHPRKIICDSGPQFVLQEIRDKGLHQTSQY